MEQRIYLFKLPDVLQRGYLLRRDSTGEFGKVGPTVRQIVVVHCIMVRREEVFGYGRAITLADRISVPAKETDPTVATLRASAQIPHDPADPFAHRLTMRFRRPFRV